jgi:hypothetical protein
VTDTIPQIAGNTGSEAAGSGLFGLGKKARAQDIGGLQATTSVLSGLGSLYAGKTRAASDIAQEAEYSAQAAADPVAGFSQATGLKQQYLQAVGQQSGRLAAGGVDVGQGVGAQNRTAMAQSAAIGEQTAILSSDIQRTKDVTNAAMAQAQAASAQGAGEMGLIGGLLGGGLKLLSAGIL